MKVCVAGVGRMGRRHIVVARNLGFSVEGIHDLSREAMAITLAECGIAQERHFSSVKEMLDQVRPEGIVVSSTGPSHCSYVCMAAEAGVRYILCEKPMAVSIAECDRMMAACRGSGAILAVNHQMRFMEQYRVVKSLCESESFGGLCSVTVAASNFGLAMNGSHYFEMFRYLTGKQIEGVSFWMDAAKVPNPRGAEYEDRSGRLLATDSRGIRLYMEIGGDQGHGIHVIYGCRYGQIFVDELAGYVRASHRRPEHQDRATTSYAMPGTDTVSQIAPADVIGPTQEVWKAMLAGEGYPDGECGRHAVAVLVAANQSGENNGALVSLATNLPRDRVFPWA
jgi:predicted dehydrogenase